MLFTREAAPARPEDHLRFVAGRYRDGAYSDLWTDVRRCAESTFTAYAPACSCGWRGRPRPVDDIAIIACHRDWDRDHGAQPSTPRPLAAAALNAPAEQATSSSSRMHRSVPCVELAHPARARVPSVHLGTSLMVSRHNAERT